MKKCLTCEVKGACACVSLGYSKRKNIEYGEHVNRCRNWFCPTHSLEYEKSLYSRPTKPSCGRQWDFGRMTGTNMEAYVPRYKNQGNYRTRYSVATYFMLAIAASQRPQRGQLTGVDGQPATNLKKAGYVKRTNKGFVLTRKGWNYVNKYIGDK